MIQRNKENARVKITCDKCGDVAEFADHEIIERGLIARGYRCHGGGEHTGPCCIKPVPPVEIIG